MFFSSLNFKLLGLGIVLLAVGYVLLGQGPVDNPLSKSVAPAILVLVYCALIPLALLLRPKNGHDSNGATGSHKSGGGKH